MGLRSIEGSNPSLSASFNCIRLLPLRCHEIPFFSPEPNVRVSVYPAELWPGWKIITTTVSNATPSLLEEKLRNNHSRIQYQRNLSLIEQFESYDTLEARTNHGCRCS